METTFISIHDLSIEARVLYASDSIVDILGYMPDEVIGKSCFEYFHPDEIPFARSIHGRGVELDKAAVLSYCRIRSKDGRWIGCECCFTVVYDVLVASTSIYRTGTKSQKRAAEAPIVRRLFSSAPRDPRYHMLSLLSSKFSQGPTRSAHEPRAAMFLNRFTRTLTIMYATTALATVLGLTPEEVKDKSFYECIQENCLSDAIRCLESAKANDSIAYMRFWFRDPRQDERMSDGGSSDDDDEQEEGGVYLPGHVGEHSPDAQSAGASSGSGTDLGANATEAIFGDSLPSFSSSSSVPLSTGLPAEGFSRKKTPPKADPTPVDDTRIEVEAVVSCSSDGLVVILRRARPIISAATQFAAPSPVYTNGLFASPWASMPIMPPPAPRGQPAVFGTHRPEVVATAAPPPHLPVFEGASGPPMDEFMNAIREVAVFAWSLVGINGNLARYGRGTPMGESQPPGGLPVWEPAPKRDQPVNDANERAYGRPGPTDDGVSGARTGGFGFTPSSREAAYGGAPVRPDYDVDGGAESQSFLHGMMGPDHRSGNNLRETGYANSRMNGGDTYMNVDSNHAPSGAGPVSHFHPTTGFSREHNGAHFMASGALDGTQYAQWSQLGTRLDSGVDGRRTTTYTGAGPEPGMGGQYRWG